MGLPEPYYDKGGITIYHGDCRDIVPHLPQVDALLTDPPYSIVNEFGTQHRLDGTRRLEFDWDKTMNADDVATAIRLAFGKCTPTAGAFVFCGSDQVGELVAAFREFDFTPKMAAWVKKCPPPAMPGTWWPSGFELAFYGYRSGAYFGDDDTKRSNVFIADSYRHGQPGKLDHPTQKPLGLMKRLVQSIVPPGGLVLDCFGGSGTTARAAKDLGRRCISIEREEKYCAIQVERLRQEVLPLGA